MNDNYLEESGLILSAKEALEKERELVEYGGEYRVVSSTELQSDLKTRGKIVVDGYNCGFPFLGSKIGQFEPGNLITVTGYSGNGKSSLLHALTRNMAQVPILWFSYENTPAQFFRKFEDVDLPLFYLPLENKPYDLSWFRERVTEATLKYGVKIIMIDHLHYLLDLFTSKNTSLDIGNLLRALKVLAVEKELVIFLVAHTKQPKAFEEPDMGSLRDSSFIVQESDKVLAVHRMRNTIDSRSKVIILKDRDHGDVWNQYSEFVIDKKLLTELAPWKQGENIKEAVDSRAEGEANLAALKDIR